MAIDTDMMSFGDELEALRKLKKQFDRPEEAERSDIVPDIVKLAFAMQFSVGQSNIFNVRELLEARDIYMQVQSSLHHGFEPFSEIQQPLVTLNRTIDILAERIYVAAGQDQQPQRGAVR